MRDHAQANALLQKPNSKINGAAKRFEIFQIKLLAYPTWALVHVDKRRDAASLCTGLHVGVSVPSERAERGIAVRFNPLIVRALPGDADNVVAGNNFGAGPKRARHGIVGVATEVGEKDSDGERGRLVSETGVILPDLGRSPKLQQCSGFTGNSLLTRLVTGTTIDWLHTRLKDIGECSPDADTARTLCLGDVDFGKGGLVPGLG